MSSKIQNICLPTAGCENVTPYHYLTCDFAAVHVSQNPSAIVSRVVLLGAAGTLCSCTSSCANRACSTALHFGCSGTCMYQIQEARLWSHGCYISKSVVHGFIASVTRTSAFSMRAFKSSFVQWTLLLLWSITTTVPSISRRTTPLSVSIALFPK